VLVLLGNGESHYFAWRETGGTSDGGVGAYGGIVDPSHLTFGPEITWMDISTHEHVDFTRCCTKIVFDVQANRTVEIMVGMTSLDGNLGNYWRDLAAGRPWSVSSPLTAGVERQVFAVLFDDMVPRGPGTPVPKTAPTSVVIHFLIENAANLELWINKIVMQ
jgi:hypothetical protein